MQELAIAIKQPIITPLHFCLLAEMKKGSIISAIESDFGVSFWNKDKDITLFLASLLGLEFTFVAEQARFYLILNLTPQRLTKLNLELSRKIGGICEGCTIHRKPRETSTRQLQSA